VPDSYIDAFDALLESGARADSGVSIEGIRKLLGDSGISSDAQSQILAIVVPPGQEGAGLGRNEFNGKRISCSSTGQSIAGHGLIHLTVLFALLALAQQNDDITLDSVDERKRNLPVPTISLPKAAKEDPPTSEPPPPTPPAQQQTPAATPNRSRAAMRKQSFGDPEADPWASPDLHRGHNHSSYASIPTQTNGAASPAATRTTSQFTTNPGLASTSNQAPPQPGSLGSEGGWGGYNGPPDQNFSGSGLPGDGFGPPSNGGGGPSAPANAGRSLGGGRVPGTGIEEVITITAIAEKEGMFMFQHRNYEVASARRNSKVIRRYSDFVWLLDCLHKRYPFRQLPLLPPKRVASESPPQSALGVN